MKRSAILNRKTGLGSGEATLSRRRFIVSVSAVAGGMALQLTPLGAAAKSVQTQSSASLAASDELSPWLKILPDDTVIVTVPTPEIGNGASTQQALNIAEELECAWEKVIVEFASFSREYKQPGSYAVGLQPFFGGHSTDHDRMPYTLQLGASARERLKTAAAQRWAVPVSEVVAQNSVLTRKR